MSKFIILFLFALLSICDMGGALHKRGQKYGEPVSFTDAKEINFPDFSLVLTGKREVPYPNANSPRKMTFYDFEINKGNEQRKVSWSSGTGDTAPTIFEISGASYVLELGQSDVTKDLLGENNLIVWKKSDYEKALNGKEYN